MGWTSFWPEPGQSTDQILRTELFRGDSHEIVAAGPGRGGWYAAVRTVSEPDRVWGLIVLVQRGGGQFSYKDMTETMGPVACDAPKKVLDALTPTDNEYANEWRNACRARLARPKVTSGARVKFAHTMTFSNGDEMDTFIFVSRNRFREGGCTYSIPGWRDRAYTVEPADA